MRTVSEIFNALCEFAPLELQMDFDNSGFLFGRGDAQVDSVLLSLDITNAVIKEAIEKNVQLIISHHPLIWSAPKAITDNSAYTEKLLTLAENGIAVISMHTNLDCAQGGVNDVLLNYFCDDMACDTLEDCGRIGILKETISMTEFLQLCKEKLGCKGIRYYNSGRKVSKLGVFGGSGADSLKEAWDKGCDTLLTADVKYHQFLEAAELGLNLIDADHFYTENPVIFELCKIIRNNFSEINTYVSQVHRAVIDFA